MNAISTMGCELGHMKLLDPLLTRLHSYPYPLFEQLDTPARALVFTGAALAMTISTVILQYTYGAVNGVGVTEKRSVPNHIKGE
jgi:hypothetical protein